MRTLNTAAQLLLRGKLERGKLRSTFGKSLIYRYSNTPTCETQSRSHQPIWRLKGNSIPRDENQKTGRREQGITIFHCSDQGKSRHWQRPTSKQWKTIHQLLEFS
jgi:hypothetical protein